MTKCIRCGRAIDPDRAQFLTETGKPATCKACSTEQAAVCFVDYAHKTAGNLVIVGTNAEQVRLATRAYKRAR